MKSVSQIVVATTSAHKISEIRELLADVAGLQVLALSDFAPIEEPEEDGATMAQNARLKAEYYARHTGLPTLADDSGIEVDAMDGAPGVRSARWVEGSDKDRVQALLDRLKNTPDDLRGARYRCALCLVVDASTSIEHEATCEGRIARAPRGDNGFGYDPIFEISQATGVAPKYLAMTMAEVAPEIKAQVSHRARAVRMLAQELQHHGGRSDA